MGVTGLWTVVAPTARPTKLETLNRKRLAVDASIWIYQFLKAVRDKEGNALRNSHVVGFFRRICKLLYFGIKPVFVFDGGAPILKRETVRARARRREGRREDAARTAGKLLAVQVARAAEDEDKRRRTDRQRTPIEEELPDDQDLVYVEEIGMDQKERQNTRASAFRKKDQYHLPDLDVSIESMGAPNDPRIMSQAELEEYARQFHSGEDINLYDFSKIDFESPFFLSLPASDRYNILNAARLRSRLRMGYSKDQLDNMFPDRMAFSKFQVERVKERNELTQRLMHINGMSEDAWDQGGRVVGEKGKEYVLVKNEGAEGGWALGVVSNRHGSRKENAIDLEDQEDSDAQEMPSEDDEDFEDVAIEGLNRIPKSWQRAKKDFKELDYDRSYEDAATAIAEKRQAVHAARRKAAEERAEANKHAIEAQVPSGDSLFVPESEVGPEEDDDLFEDVDIGTFSEHGVVDEDDDELRKAIAMSLEQPETSTEGKENYEGGSKSHLIDEDEVDITAALAESRRSKHLLSTNAPHEEASRPQSKFDGPLPFESMNLGQSLLGKKKAKKVDESLSGGFDRNTGDNSSKKKPAQPIPAWFDTAPSHQEQKRGSIDDEDQSYDNVDYGLEYESDVRRIQKSPAHEVINVDEDDADHIEQQLKVEGYIGGWDPSAEPDLVPELAEEPEGQDAAEAAAKEREETAREARYKIAMEIAAENEDEPRSKPEMKQALATNTGSSVNMLMDDVAEQLQAEPPKPENIQGSIPDFVPQVESQNEEEADVEWSQSEDEDILPEQNKLPSPKNQAMEASTERTSTRLSMQSEENGESQHDDEDVEFEDVEVLDSYPQENDIGPVHQVNKSEKDQDVQMQEYDGYLSDSDEELMQQLLDEAEEHARFTADLNNTKTTEQAARDYENELKQLRNQQKKDRRDADEVTQVMIQECQALLRLFGLPYITAPMEAEAQCAELVHLGLVDGIVTDDSDIFLFGGTRIYKNMFNAAKFVECYVTSDLEKEYALDRQKLIRFAHLLGSDYTEGIPGVGPVTALEIISDFTDLSDFKEWCSRVQLGQVEGELTTSFRRKFKKTVQKRLFLPSTFPDVRVDHAYLRPDVDSDPEDFQWGVPDLEKLRSFLMATIGWSQDRTDEVLVPVIRDMNQRAQEGTQANLTRFFTGGVGVGGLSAEGAAPRNRTGKESGRMKNAYSRLRGEAEKRRLVDGDDMAEGAEDEPTEEPGAALGKTGNGDMTDKSERSESGNITKANASKKRKKAKG